MKEQWGCYGGEIKTNSNSLPQQISANNVRILLLPSTNFQVYGLKFTWVTHDEQHIPMAGSAVLSGFQKHQLQVGFILGFFWGGGF